jgi:hypothetical protein
MGIKTPLTLCTGYARLAAIVLTSRECFSYICILLKTWHGPESHLAPEVVLTRSARDVAIGA